MLEHEGHVPCSCITDASRKDTCAGYSPSRASHAPVTRHVSFKILAVAMRSACSGNAPGRQDLAVARQRCLLPAAPCSRELRVDLRRVPQQHSMQRTASADQWIAGSTAGGDCGKRCQRRRKRQLLLQRSRDSCLAGLSAPLQICACQTMASAAASFAIYSR